MPGQLGGGPRLSREVRKTHFAVGAQKRHFFRVKIVRVVSVGGHFGAERIPDYT